VTPCAAAPSTDAVFEGADRTFSPTGLNTVRGPLAWMATVVDDPEAATDVVVVASVAGTVVFPVVECFPEPEQAVIAVRRAPATTPNRARRCFSRAAWSPINRARTFRT